MLRGAEEVLVSIPSEISYVYTIVSEFQRGRYADMCLLVCGRVCVF